MGKNLPAYTTAENIVKLVECLRKKNNDEKEAKPLFGLAESGFANTKSALIAFCLLEEEGFTELGRELAYANQDGRRQAMLKVLLSFSAYEVALQNTLQKGTSSSSDLDAIVAHWGRFDFGSTERNRQDAAKLFASIIEYVGLGQFIKGVKGTATRIAWSADAISLLGRAQENAPSAVTDVDSVRIIGAPVESPQNKEPNLQLVRSTQEQSPVRGAPQIVVKVDMAGWSKEEIRDFFRYAYGHFDGEDQR
ncbi:MAG: hypothetical protein KGZ53_03835 [Peptococcaceae bacterium]|nr:hypothetical protein [Peptococcaceae bacterium]